MTDAPEHTTAETTPEGTETGAPEATAKKRGKPQRRLFPKDWWEIASMAKSGVPVHKIAKNFGVQRSTIYRGLKERKIVIGAYSPSPGEDRAKAEREELVKKVLETKTRDYTYTDFLQRQIIGIVTDAQKTKQPVGAFIEDLKALKIALDAVRNGTSNKWMILGLDKENADADVQLPELPVRELTPAEMHAIRDKQALEDLDDAALEKLDEEVIPDEEDEVVEEGDSEPEEPPAGS